MKDLRLLSERLSLCMALICVILLLFFSIFKPELGSGILGLNSTYFHTDLLVFTVVFLSITFYKTDGARMPGRLLNLFGSITLLINEIMLWLTKNKWDNYFCTIMIVSIVGFLLRLLSCIQKRFHLIYKNKACEVMAITLLLISVIISITYNEGNMLYVIIINCFGIILMVLNILEYRIQKEIIKQEKRRRREI